MHIDATILLELGLLLIVLTAMSGLAWRVGFTAAPLFLLVGLLLGEGSVVDFEESRGFLEVAAGLGVIMLLLTLGLEFSVGEFQQSLRRHAPTGVVDFALNATPGFVAGLLLDLDIAAALALGGITWVSSSGIVAKLLGDLGRLGYRETPAILSVLVLEDLAMAGFLPLLGVLLVGGHILAGVLGSVLAVLVAVAVILALRKLEGWANRVFSHDDDEQVLLRVLGITFLVAGLAEWAGVSAAVGAFLVGLSIPSPAVERVRALLAPLRDLFAALFFFVFGLSIELASIPGALPAALALAAVTIVTKVATGWFAAGREGVGLRGRMRAGTALIARGEFSVVMAGLAVAAGYSTIGPVASTYVLIVAVAGPILTRSSDWITKQIFGPPQSRRRMAGRRLMRTA